MSKGDTWKCPHGTVQWCEDCEQEMIENNVRLKKEIAELREKVKELKRSAGGWEADALNYAKSRGCQEELTDRYLKALEKVVQYAERTVKKEALNRVYSYVVASTAIHGKDPRPPTDKCKTCKGSGKEWVSNPHMPSNPPWQNQCRNCLPTNALKEADNE